MPSVIRWAGAHADSLGGDPQRLVVSGDSAGGNLAAVTPLLCRERGTTLPVAQVLLYPMIDPSYTPDVLATGLPAEFVAGTLLVRKTLSISS